MASYDYDLIVIGSGQAGAIAAQQVAKTGKRVAIVESGTFGGSEVRSGTIPLAALLHSASLYEAARQGSRFGVRGATIGYNYPTIKAWKNLVVKRTGIQGGEDAFTAMGINVVHGRAYFIDPHTITIGAARFTSHEFLIATGTKIILPDVPGLSQSGFLTTNQVLDLNRPPKKLALLGGGQHSYEIAQLFAMLGSKVYFIEPAATLAPTEEPETSAHLADLFEDKYSMSILTAAAVEKVRVSGLQKKLTVRIQEKQAEITVDEIIIATKQNAATDIGLENAGVTLDSAGIAVNAKLQTSTKHIFAAGGCVNSLDNGHSAAYQSQVAAHNILHPKRMISAESNALPRIILTKPEIAAVGPTEKELQDAGRTTQSTTTSLSVVPQANITDFSEGFVKLVVDKKTGVILSATVVCPQAADVLQELILAVRHRLTVHDLAHTIHSFPSWSEAVRVAAAQLSR